MLATDLAPQTSGPPTPVSIDWFQRGTVDIRLAVLHFLAQHLHQISAHTLPSAFFSQMVQQLIRQVEQVSDDQKADVLADMVAGANTRLVAAYDQLDTNMKIAFWYRLVNKTHLMTSVVPSLRTTQQWRLETRLRELAKCDINELLQIFKTTVAMTGRVTTTPA